MILHSPIFSGSINQAESAYANLSGSFTGSFKGVGDFEGLVADSIDYANIFNTPTLVSGSSQISYPDISNIPSGIISSSAQIDTLFDIDGLVSGGAQVEFNTINNNPFSQSASSVTVSKNIVPTTNSITLGTAQNPFQDLYLSSASLYIDGTQVISSNTTELIITTDENQSLKLVETGADTITLQTANGDITITTTGTGNIELDAPIQIAAGNQIISSDGNAIQIGEDISVTGNIAVTGTVDGVDVAALKASFDTLNGKSVISGSSQVTISDTTGYSTFSSSLDSRISTEKGRIDAILLSADADKDSFAEIVSLINSVDTTNDNAFASFYTSSNNTNAAQDARLSSLETASGSAITRLDALEGTDITVTLSGDVSGTGTITDLGDVTISTTIQPNSVALGTDTTGNYMSNVSAGNAGISISHTQGEGSTATISLVSGVVSGSSQVNADSITNFDTNVLAYNNSLGVISGSSQVLGNTGIVSSSAQIDSLGFLKVGGDSVISGSSQVTLSGDITGTANNTAIASGVIVNDDVNASAAIAYTKLNLQGSGIVSGSSQVFSDVSGDVVIASNGVATIQANSVALGTDTTGNYVAGVTAGNSIVISGTAGEGWSPTITVGNGVVSGSSQIDALGFLKVGGDDVVSGSATVLRTTTQFGGDVTGTYDAIVISDDSHNHIIGNVDGLQTALDGKVSTNSSQALSSAANALTFAANTLTLTRGDGSTDTVNLSAYLDDTNLARIISGTYDAGTTSLVFTRDDASTFSIDASMFFDDTNLVTSVGAGTGISVNSTTGGVVVTNSDRGSSQSIFKNVAVSGQTTVVADSNNDTLTLAAGSNVTITTNATTDTITIASTDTNTTYSAGNGISLSGTTFSVAAGNGLTQDASGLSMSGTYTGTFSATGDIIAYSSSDKRLKDNIKNIESPIEKVKQINGVTWDWNENASELQHTLPNVGVIAQEVEEVFPQLVRTNEGGYKAVDYDKLVGLLIEAVKDQQKQIDELKSKLG